MHLTSAEIEVLPTSSAGGADSCAYITALITPELRLARQQLERRAPGWSMP